MIPMAIPSKSLWFDPLGEEAERKWIFVTVFSALLCNLLMMDHCLMTDCPHIDMIAPHDKDPLRADG
jgi:hypothetical protein